MAQQVDWKGVLGKLAPTAATLLGGPFAGLAVGTIAQALGLGTDAKIDQVQAAIASGTLSGEQIVALKQAELSLQQHLVDNNIKLEEIAMEDRDSARKREAAVKDYTPQIIAATVILGTVIVEGIVLFGVKTSVDGVILGRILGTMDSALMLVLSYYFGSSAGSRSKDDTIKNLSS